MQALSPSKLTERFMISVFNAPIPSSSVFSTASNPLTVLAIISIDEVLSVIRNYSKEKITDFF